MSRGDEDRLVAVAPARCLLVWVVATVAGLALGAGLAGRLGGLPRTLAAGTVDEAIVSLAALALLGCAGWVWLVASATLAEVWRRGGVASTDGIVRRLVLLACGAALVTAVAAPATAVDERATDPHATGVLDGLRLPERATPAAPGRGPAAVDAAEASADPAPSRGVVVRPGDSLWRIAEQALAGGADAAAVDTAWRRLHSRNRDVIGADPDLILPGQRLALPRLEAPSSDPAHRE